MGEPDEYKCYVCVQDDGIPKYYWASTEPDSNCKVDSLGTEWTCK